MRKRALRGHDQLAGISRRAAPTRARRKPMGILLHQGMGIGNGNSEMGAAHDRQIHDIISHVRGIRRREIQSLQQGIENRTFFSTSLVEMGDPKLRHAPCHHRGISPGNYADFHAAFPEHLHAVAIADMKRLVFIIATIEIETTIGEYAIYVENDDFDIRGPIHDFTGREDQRVDGYITPAY